MNRNTVKILFPLFLWLIAAVLYYSFFFTRAHVNLEIEVTQRTWFKIYWADEGEPFSEKRMARVRVNPNQTSYHFYLTDLKKVARLRVDPHQYAGESVVRKIHITQKSVRDIILDTSDQFSELKPLAQIDSFSSSNEALRTISTGLDPNFLYELKISEKPVYWQQEVLRVGAIGLFIFFLYWGTAALVIEFRFVPICVSIILVLTATMAIISKENSHPDEFVHVFAAEYYSEHWLPPVIEDESIRHTYSRYGASRLHTNEVYYLLCGKFSNIIKPLHLNNYVQYRMFNVFLLFAVLMYLFQNQGARLLALPFLVSPQIWYLFSYCNSDALAVVVAFFTGCQVILGDSLLNRYIRSRGGFSWVLKVMFVGICFGTLLLVKKNYWAYAGVLGVVTGISWWRCSDVSNRKIRLRRLAIVALIALSVLASKKIVDYTVNGPDRSAKIAQIRTEIAEPMFNPATPLEEKNPSLSRKDRGVTLERTIVVDRWFEKTFRSAFGVYGYFTISGFEVYYDLVRWTGVILLTFLFGTIFIRGGMWNSFSALLILGTATALVSASLYHSWTADFQAQGRYLFPIVGMLSLLLGQNREILSFRWMGLLTMVMYFLSLYSFTAVALLAMPRLATG